MVTLSPSPASVLAPAPHSLLRRLGLLNGCLVGLAVAAGAWGPDAISAVTPHMAWVYLTLIAGTLLVSLIGGLAGWLTARFDSALAGGLAWFGAAWLMTMVIGYLPYTGRTITIWLLDQRFWGLPIYPPDAAAQARMIAGFFLGLCLVILGALQPDRLESVQGALTPAGRLTRQAWFRLAWPLLIVFGTGLLMDENINQPLRSAAQVVNAALPVARTYPGDLVTLGRQQNTNYGALAPVRGQLGEHYRLIISDLELTVGLGQTVMVTTHFDTGGWINCRILGDELSFCEDARPPYFQSFPALLAGEAPADLPANAAWRAWLSERSVHFREAPRVTWLAQWGQYVLMRAEAADSHAVVECLFSGLQTVQLERCADTGP